MQTEALIKTWSLCEPIFFVCPRPVCGKPTKLISTYQRIIGSSADNTIPWHVLLDINGRTGGGMLIADSWIMTAAHVLTHYGNITSSEAVRVSGLLWCVVLSACPLPLCFWHAWHLFPPVLLICRLTWDIQMLTLWSCLLCMLLQSMFTPNTITPTA